MNRTNIFIAVFVFLLSFALSIKSQNLKETGGLKNVSDNAVLKLLSSENSVESESAAKEIFSRGEKLLPELMKLKGDNRCFYGLSALGRWGSGVVRGFPPCSGSDKVTIEIAALFLISAIYMEDLQFAAPPYLCEKDCLEGGNTNKRVNKAWKATQRWYSAFKRNGIARLREKAFDPLFNSGLRF